jgi:hypothetical protein
VARVPAGQFDHELEYWTSSGWSDKRGDRHPVLTSEISMPASVQRFGDLYVAASDEGDWFGDDVVVYTAAAPQGPWFEAMRYTPQTTCGEGCNNYGAFVLPQLEGDRVVIAQSNNARDMRYAFELASLYRPDVRAVEVPGISAANIGRSPNMDLARAEPEPVPEIKAASRPAIAPSAPLPTPDEVSVLEAAVQPTPDAAVWHVARLAAVVLLLAGTGLWTPIAGLTLLRSIRRTRIRRRSVLTRLGVAHVG